MAFFVRAPAKDVFLIASLALLFEPGTASASRSSPSPAAETHFVWRVTSLTTPFYLVGSIHTLSEKDYPLPPIYQTALTNSRRVIFEYNPRQREALARKFRETARYPEGKDIESEISPTTFALLKKNAWRMQVRYEVLRHYRPWAIALRLLAEQGPLGPSSPRSMDAYLSSEAQRSGKEVGGLETVDEHVAFWREMVESDGENLLFYALTHEKTVGSLVDKTREAWKRGDITALAATNTRLHQASPGLAQKLLDRRNATWVLRIEAEMRSGKPTAIVAGAGHFLGPQGVLELLRERGYRIERL